MTERRKEFPPKFWAPQYSKLDSFCGGKLVFLTELESAKHGQYWHKFYLRLEEYLSLKEHTAILEQERKRSRGLLDALKWIYKSEILEERIPFPRKEEVLEKIRRSASEAVHKYRSGEGVK